MSPTLGEKAYQAELLKVLENSEDGFFITQGYHQKILRSGVRFFREGCIQQQEIDHSQNGFH